jgi:hypothetical protein
MAFSLTWLPTVLLDAGLKVAEQPGWRTRGCGDVGPIRGVICTAPLPSVIPAVVTPTRAGAQDVGPFLCEPGHGSVPRPFFLHLAPTDKSPNGDDGLVGGFAL